MTFKRLTIEIQGRADNDVSALIYQLDKITDRLRAGDYSGAVFLDDFGYRFSVDQESVRPSLFPVEQGFR
jgi:hypothetical protein